MAAYVGHGAQGPIGAANDEDRLRTDPQRDEVTRGAQLRHVRRIGPLALEDQLRLPLEYLGREVLVASQAAEGLCLHEVSPCHGFNAAICICSVLPIEKYGATSALATPVMA